MMQVPLPQQRGSSFMPELQVGMVEPEVWRMIKACVWAGSTLFTLLFNPPSLSWRSPP